MNTNNLSLNIQKVSVHGGHSGQFCHHARSTLQEVVEAYISEGFSWVGLTEHMPPTNDHFRYPDEVDSNLKSTELKVRFREYFRECRRLQALYKNKIVLLAAFETEHYPGSIHFIQDLIAETQPDYIVGSVHHVHSHCIDYNLDHYKRALDVSGSLEQLYCDYFDAQYDLIMTLKPSVVGHFDLIRIFDDNYKSTLALSNVKERITRNLTLIAQENLILDYNLRGLFKGQEPYPSERIVDEAIALGIAVVPGDDSHGVSSVGAHWETALQRLLTAGHNCQWERPKLYSY